MPDSIICSGVFEPAAFFPAADRAVHVSLAADMQDEATAKARYRAFLDAVPKARFFLYRHDAAATKLIRVGAAGAPLMGIGPEPSEQLSTEIFHWLEKRIEEEESASWVKPPRDDETFHYRDVGAAQLLAASESWHAPIPQAAGLSRLISAPDATGAGPWLIVPFFATATAPDEISPVTEVRVGAPPSPQLDHFAFDYVAGLFAAEGSPAPAIGAKIRPLQEIRADPSLLVDLDSGFLKVDAEADRLHAALRRVRERSGSLLWAAPQLLGIDWMPPPDAKDAPVVPERLQILQRVLWRALNGLAVLLDPVFTSLTMAGASREGPFAAALKAVIEEFTGAPREPLDATGIEEWITSAVEKDLRPPPIDDAPARETFATLYARLFGLESMLGFPPRPPALAAGNAAPMALEEIPRLLPLALTLYALHGAAGQVLEPEFDPKSLGERFGNSLDVQLDIELGELVQRLESEQGIEDMAVAVLERLSLSDEHLGRRLNLIDNQLGDVAQGKTIFARFRQFLAGGFNGLDASRLAQGSVFEAAVAARDAGGSPADLVAVEAAVNGGRWFAERLGLSPDQAGAPGPFAQLAGYLPLVMQEAELPAEDRAHLAVRLAESYNEVAAAILAHAPARPRRFVPDAVPQPLPIRVAVDQDLSDLDGFASHFDGVALLVRRGAEDWTYANLAKLKNGTSWPALTVHPLQPAAVDGQRLLFLEYEGAPLASTEISPDAEERLSAFYSYEAPDLDQLIPGWKPLPPFAYGLDFGVAAHVIGRSGALPRMMQLPAPTPTEPDGRVPWLPRPAAPAPDAAYIQPFECRRTTAIGRVTIAGEEAGFGRRLDGVEALADDYPRTGFMAPAGATSQAELWRAADGSGQLPLPHDEGTALTTLLEDVRASGTGRLQVEVMRDPAALPDGPAIGSWSVAVTGPVEHGVLRLDVVRIGDDCRFALAVEHSSGLVIEGAASFDVEIKPAAPLTPFWLRLRLAADAAGPLSLSLADPRLQSSVEAAGGQTPDSLILLAPQRGGDWKQDVPTEAKVHVYYPRMGYIDFDRWLSNPDLCREAAAGEDSKLKDLRIRLIRARLLGDASEQMWSRLPDLAVKKLLVELVPVDTLAPAANLGSRHSMEIAVDRLGEWLRGEDVASLVQRQLLKASTVRGEPPYEAYGARLTVRAGAELAIERGGTPRDWIATVPPGVVARLTVRPMVPALLFGEGGAEIIDPRLRQLATDRRNDYYVFDGPSVAIEVMQPLQTPSQSWPAVAATLVDVVPAGLERRYDLAVLARRLEPGPSEISTWRQFSHIDVQTQRWRFLGTPIRSWFDPNSARLTPLPPDAVPGPVVRLETGDEGLAGFEREAFLGRDELDADSISVKLRPLTATEPKPGTVSTVLQTIPWEPPSATLFRHRLVGRSRYAGALISGGKAEVSLHPDNDKTFLGRWIRIALLADRTRVQLVRPQLRALLPLTASPGEELTPPVLALLEEPPFSHGGLADRIGSEIRTGFGFEIQTGRGPATGDESLLASGEDLAPEPELSLQVRDARKEVGPDPRLDYFPTPESLARALTLAPEGPVGLTFDAPAAPAPAFANAAFVLHPAFTTDEAQRARPNLEEHFLSVGLRRYLDPDWVVPEASRPDPDALDPAQPWWIEWPDGLPDGKVQVDCIVEARPEPTGESPSPSTEERCLSFCEVERGGGRWTVRVGARAILPTESDIEWLEVAVADVVVGSSIALLHQPLEEGRAALSVFCSNGLATAGQGRGTLMLASVEWTVGKRAVARMLKAPRAKASPIAASPPTLMNWTRTGRNFDRLHVVDAARDWSTAAVAELSVGIVGQGAGRRTSFVRGDTSTAVWPRPALARAPSPLYVHRQIALIVTRDAAGLGRRVEVFQEAWLLPRIDLPPLASGQRNRRVRVVEFEMPAQPIAARTPMSGFEEAFFDLRAIGATGTTDRRVDGLLLCVRLLGDAAKGVGTGWSMELAIRTGDETSIGQLIKVRIAGNVDPATAAHMLLILPTVARPETPAAAMLVDTGGVAHPLIIDSLLPLGVLEREAVRVSGFNIPSIAGSSEYWADLSLLTLSTAAWPVITASGLIEGIPFSFDWLFTGTATNLAPSDAVTAAALRKTFEAEARVLAVSPPIAVDTDVP